MSRDVLLRYVRVAGGDDAPKPEVRVDLARTMPGRGVNVGPSPACLERAVKRGAVQRQWRLPISHEGLELLVAQTREALGERLAGYVASAWARGGLEAVAAPADIEPREARVLWESEVLRELVSGIPPARAKNPRIAAKIKALSCAVSEFTFTRVGGMKRRPEAPEACEALERCGGGAIRGSVKTRRERVGAGPSHTGPDGRNG